MSLRATSPPVLPQQFIDLVPDSPDDVCDVLIKFFKFLKLEYAMWRYKYGADGELTEAFSTEICLALDKCSQVGDATTEIYIDDPVYVYKTGEIQGGTAQ